MNNFVILGGGTAGWITAIFARKLFPNANVCLIESKQIGIIGVGEATTPHIVNFLKSHDIDPLDVIRVTNGTIKNGINFENWNGDGKRYFHDFHENLKIFNIANVYENGCDDFFKKLLINKQLSFEEYIYQQKLAYGNKIDLNNTNYALHFDAVKFANYLENVGKQRNIEVIDDMLQQPILNEDGSIKSLKLESGKIVDCDFVFDCTGFARLLIGKLYKSKWHSYSNFLPAKKAIPFWLENKEDIAPYTSCIAMKNGWMWNIPLQHRLGAGYVFDSDYASVDQAKQEVEEQLGHEIEVRKVIEFDPGRFDQVWIKNCLAVGLSANFLEPLESTSLWLATSQLTNFKQFINELKDPDPSSRDLFNKVTRNEADEKAHFVYFHYLTKRNDSKFWQEFKVKNEVPDKFKELLKAINESNIRYYHFNDIFTPAVFPMHSYLQVGNGLGMFKNKFKLDFLDNINPTVDEYKAIVDQAFETAPYHIDLLKHLQKG
jgi:tryptophan halogenase